MTEQKHQTINDYLRGRLADSVTATTSARTGRTTGQHGEEYADANDLLFRLVDRTYRRNSTRRVANLDDLGHGGDNGDGQGAA